MTNQKEKLSKLITMLFESKLRSYTKITLATWVQLLKKFNYKMVEMAIERIIYREGGFIEVATVTQEIKNIEKTERKMIPSKEYWVQEYAKYNGVSVQEASITLKDKTIAETKEEVEKFKTLNDII